MAHNTKAQPFVNSSIALPIEITLKICSFLKTPVDLCYMALTCRHWELVTKDERIWKYWYESLNLDCLLLTNT